MSVYSLLKILHTLQRNLEHFEGYWKLLINKFLSEFFKYFFKYIKIFFKVTTIGDNAAYGDFFELFLLRVALQYKNGLYSLSSIILVNI